MRQEISTDSPPGQPPTPRRRARRGEGHRLRGELIAAASALLAELGDANQLSMRAVADAAGVTPPSIYRHFPDKQALLDAVLEERWQELYQALAAAVEDDPFRSLRAVCLAYVRFAEEHPGHYRVLFSAAGPAGVTEERARHPGGPSFNLLLEAIQRCLDAGAAVPAGRDSWFLAAQIWVTGHGVIDLRYGQRFPFPWPPAETLLDALLSDLGLSEPPPRRGRRRPAT
jgi:AcrR family transcriptional regulator